MKTIEYLQNYTLEDIQEEYGIRHTLHKDGRVILNYSQIDSPKTHPITRECRSLVLDANRGFRLIARSFSRFFNLGEYLEEQRDFKWHSCVASDKEDGSLITIYYWQNSWHINTKSSFADGIVGNSGMTWAELVELAMPDEWRQDLDIELTYVGEICSLYNKIVRTYKKPTFYLLTCFLGVHELKDVKKHAVRIKFNMPHEHVIYGADHAQKFIRMQAENDATYEGLVLRDSNNQRIKVKSDQYLILHKLANNGDPCHPKNIVPLLLAGEKEEILTYFPEIKQQIYEIEAILNERWEELNSLWNCFHDEPDQKTFALAIKDRTPFSGILFTARSTGVSPKELWLDSSNLIIKRLFS